MKYFSNPIIRVAILSTDVFPNKTNINTTQIRIQFISIVFINIQLLVNKELFFINPASTSPGIISSIQVRLFHTYWMFPFSVLHSLIGIKRFLTFEVDKYFD